MTLPAVTTFLGVREKFETVYIGTLEDDESEDAEYTAIIASPDDVVEFPAGRQIKDLGLINPNGDLKYVWVVYPE